MCILPCTAWLGLSKTVATCTTQSLGDRVPESLMTAYCSTPRSHCDSTVFHSYLISNPVYALVSKPMDALTMWLMMAQQGYDKCPRNIEQYNGYCPMEKANVSKTPCTQGIMAGHPQNTAVVIRLENRSRAGMGGDDEYSVTYWWVR